MAAGWGSEPDFHMRSGIIRLCMRSLAEIMSYASITSGLPSCFSGPPVFITCTDTKQVLGKRLAEGCGSTSGRNEHGAVNAVAVTFWLGQVTQFYSNIFHSIHSYSILVIHQALGNTLMEQRRVIQNLCSQINLKIYLSKLGFHL